MSCGQNASEVLLASGINIYKAAHTAVADNLKALAEGKLEILIQFHPGFHGSV
jgi:predicted Fe-Mo cluster-binding NifX family protein